MQEWLDEFGDAENVFAVTISKNLSGSYNAAKEAAGEFKAANPDKNIFIFDSLSAGPQQAMVIDKLRDLINEGYDFRTVKEKALDYHNHTHIIFALSP